ncbi:Kynureninase (L-kynurenine hydrolase) [Savitreella phatthalungensis]
MADSVYAKGSIEYAQWMDEQPIGLGHLRDEFEFPTRETIGLEEVPTDLDTPLVYVCGNSLGLLPKRSRTYIAQELDVWSTRGVAGHFAHPHGRPWKDVAETVVGSVCGLVGGADVSEVAVMGSLTANLHALLASFYRPVVGGRTKIICEAKAFPSDEYAFQSQCLLHGLDPAEHLLHITPRPHELTLRTDDILAFIDLHKDTAALLLLSGVQYYTGQLFDIPRITAFAKARGLIVGWDLAHAVGNVPLELHAWGVDFGVWCHYKYVNGGPGAIGGIFVHTDARYPPPAIDTTHQVRLAGWWGHNRHTRFAMPDVFDPEKGAWGYQLSNPSVLDCMALRGSLDVFDMTSMDTLRAKSVAMSTMMLEVLQTSPYYRASVPSPAGDGDDGKITFAVISPMDVAERGAQLSIGFYPREKDAMMRAMSGLLKRGVIGDERKPEVIRIAPAPLYNTFVEAWKAATAVVEVVRDLNESIEVQKPPPTEALAATS